MSIGDGLLATDENGNITFINKIAEKLFGKKGEEVMGKSFFEVIDMEDENDEKMNMSCSAFVSVTSRR